MKKQKGTILLILLLGGIIFGNNQLFLFVEEHLKQNFTKYQIENNLHIYLAQTIIDESEFVNCPDINPLLVLALMEQESTYRNVFGDNGNAVGFFQIHEDTANYVATFYPDIKKKLEQLKSFKDLRFYPVLQTKIAIRYLYLTYKYRANQDLLITLTLYNGRNPNFKYNVYIAGIMSKYSKILERYIGFEYK